MGKNEVKISRFGEFISEGSLIIKDPVVFKLTHTPEQIVERKETHEFFRELSTFVRYRKPNHMIIKGFPGSGKTVTVNFVINELKKERPEIKTFIENCNARSEIEILQNLVKERPVGSFRDLSKRFIKSIDGDAIIVLDEIDRSNKIENLLYFLSRPNEIVPEFKGNINVILVSNNLRWEDGLKDRVRSSLQLKTIVFMPYSIPQIKNILRARIKAGFINEKAISDELVNKIAEETEKIKRGDCRVAIETVFYSAQNAEMDKRTEVSEQDIKKALKLSIEAADREKMSKLQDHQLLVLYSALFHGNQTLTEVYQNYLNTLKNLPIKPQTRVMAFHIVNYLENLGFLDRKIEIIKDQKGIPHRTMKIKVKIEPERVLDELNIRDLRLQQLKKGK